MDPGQPLYLLLGLGLLLCFSAFFSGSETALCALSKVQVERLRGDSKKSSLAIVNFVDNPRRLFITILLGNVIVNIAFSTLTAALIYSMFAGTAEVAGASGIAVAVATVLITIFLLIFGEITPKTYAIRHAEAFARATLDRILQLRDIEANQIMVPRTEMIAMRTSSTIAELTQRARSAGISRIPVYRQRIDDLCGIFHVKDLRSGARWTSMAGRSISFSSGEPGSSAQSWRTRSSGRRFSSSRRRS